MPKIGKSSRTWNSHPSRAHGWRQSEHEFDARWQITVLDYPRVSIGLKKWT
jgi:hypothetical protein